MLKKIKNVESAKGISKESQKRLNGGFEPIVCRGTISISPDGTCPPGQRLIDHCFCCDD
ncbi:MAG: hypothetical protein WBA74_12720 [Cyclobacteriaceae bacterium]